VKTAYIQPQIAIITNDVFQALFLVKAEISTQANLNFDFLSQYCLGLGLKEIHFLGRPKTGIKYTGLNARIFHVPNFAFSESSQRLSNKDTFGSIGSASNANKLPTFSSTLAFKVSGSLYPL
jgi:hypothetical protein